MARLEANDSALTPTHRHRYSESEFSYGSLGAQREAEEEEAAAGAAARASTGDAAVVTTVATAGKRERSSSDLETLLGSAPARDSSPKLLSSRHLRPHPQADVRLQRPFDGHPDMWRSRFGSARSRQLNRSYG